MHKLKKKKNGHFKKKSPLYSTERLLRSFLPSASFIGTRLDQGEVHKETLGRYFVCGPFVFLVENKAYFLHHIPLLTATSALPGNRKGHVFTACRRLVGTVEEEYPPPFFSQESGRPARSTYSAFFSGRLCRCCRLLRLHAKPSK